MKYNPILKNGDAVENINKNWMQSCNESIKKSIFYSQQNIDLTLAALLKIVGTAMSMSV